MRILFTERGWNTEAIEHSKFVQDIASATETALTKIKLGHIHIETQRFPSRSDLALSAEDGQVTLYVVLDSYRSTLSDPHVFDALTGVSSHNMLSTISCPRAVCWTYKDVPKALNEHLVSSMCAESGGLVREVQARSIKADLFPFSCSTPSGGAVYCIRLDICIDRFNDPSLPTKNIIARLLASRAAHVYTLCTGQNHESDIHKRDIQM